MASRSEPLHLCAAQSLTSKPMLTTKGKSPSLASSPSAIGLEMDERASVTVAENVNVAEANAVLMENMAVIDCCLEMLLVSLRFCYWSSERP